MQILLQDWQPAETAVLQTVAKVLEECFQAEQGIITVKASDELKIRELNKAYAGSDQPTDVLSFDYWETTPDSKLSGASPARSRERGDVVIARDIARAQARGYGSSEEAELALLMTHGVLHVLGFDHQQDKQQRAMESLQDMIVTKSGFRPRSFHWQAHK